MKSASLVLNLFMTPTNEWDVFSLQSTENIFSTSYPARMLGISDAISERVPFHALYLQILLLLFCAMYLAILR